jgi:hypothetical protein
MPSFRYRDVFVGDYRYKVFEAGSREEAKRRSNAIADDTYLSSQQRWWLDEKRGEDWVNIAEGISKPKRL